MSNAEIFDAIQHFDLKTAKELYETVEKNDEHHSLNLLLAMVEKQALSNREKPSSPAHPDDPSNVEPVVKMIKQPINPAILNAIQDWNLDTVKEWYEAGEETDEEDPLSRLLAMVEKQALSHEEKPSPPPAHTEAPTGDVTPNDECYPLDENPGCVLIISNTCQGDRPEASKADLNMMHDLWVTTIGCELHNPNEEKPDLKDEKTRRTYQYISKRIKKHRNQTADDMRYLLKTLAETQNKYSYIVVIISTHGGLEDESFVKECEKRGEEKKNWNPKEFAKICKKAHNKYIKKKENETGDKVKEQRVPVFYGENWQPVRESEMFEMFYNVKAPNFKDKPKFFILDYCRSEPDYGKKIKKGRPIYKGDNTTSEPVTLMPIMSDIITAYATHRSFPAYDDEDDEGSWLITAIAEVFKQYYKKKSVVDMMTLVNARMKKRCCDEEKTEEGEAMSIFESSLVKEFRLYNKDQE